MKKSEFVTFRTTSDIKNKLETLAKEQERTISWILNKILENYLKEKDPT